MITGNVWDAVGQTPLLKIESLSQLSGCHIFAKAEFMNPGGSVKDRAAKGIIERAEREGHLLRGGTIVEGTAGNTGIGLATLAASRGYRCVISMPDNQAPEKYQLLGALGAEVHSTPAVPFADPRHFFHRAKVLAENIPGSFWANQFENLANGDIHYHTTGAEIWEQTKGKIDIFVTAVGTGGTISGVSRYLKEKKPSIQVLAADPMGSGIFCQIKTGEMQGSGTSITEGIGIMRLTSNFLSARIDDAMRVSDQQMIDMLIYLSQNDGLVVGTSAALNVHAAFELALRFRGSGKTIVTVLCDHGTRYTSRVFNPQWRHEKGLIPRPDNVLALAQAQSN